MRASHTAIRRHTIEVGKALELQQIDAALAGPDRQSQEASSMVVGIDDTYARHRERLASRQIQVTAGACDAMQTLLRSVLSRRVSPSGCTMSRNLRHRIDHFGPGLR